MMRGNSPCKGILIFQQIMMHYRVPVFNQLADKLGIPVTIAYGALGSDIPLQDLRFELLPVTIRKTGPFRRVPELQTLCRDKDLAILPFDIHELSVLRVLSISRASRLPIVLWGHSHGSRAIAKPVRHWMASRAASVLLYTEYGRQKLVKEGLDASKLFVANNTVDIENSDFASDIERGSFLFSGRLTKRKRIDEAIQAFASIEPKVPRNVRFEIIGDGPEREPLEQLVRNVGLESRFDFHGYVYDPTELRTIFQRSLAFVSPGHVGLAVLHSFAYGIPPLTRREANHAPEFHHIQDNVNGLLFNGTLGDLAQKMASLTTGTLSTDLGENGYAYYQANCTLDRATDGIVASIQHAIAPN